MLKKDVNSAHALQEQIVRNVDVNEANGTHLAASPFPQAQGANPDPEVQNGDTENGDVGTHMAIPPGPQANAVPQAPQGQNGGYTEMRDLNEANGTHMVASLIPQAQAARPGPQVQNGVICFDRQKNDIEMGIRTHMLEPPSPQAQAEQEIVSHAPQAQATQPNPQVHTQSEPPRDHRPLCTNPGQVRDPSVELYKAALNGDWKTAKRLLEVDQKETVRASITKETVLHVAAGASQTKFVKKLVRMMEREDLELPDENGNTALCLAAAAGAKSTAKIMLEKNDRLAEVRGNKGVTPLHIAAQYGQLDMVKFLHLKTNEQILNEQDRSRLFFKYIDIDLFDLALGLLNNDLNLAFIGNEVDNVDTGTALHMLARKPSAFPSKSPRIWKAFINSCMPCKQSNHALELVRRLWTTVLQKDDSMVLSEIRKPNSLFLEAAELGNFEFLAELVRLYPKLIWETDKNNQTIFHIAVSNRHVNIFNQIHKIGSMKDIIANYVVGSKKNNILHLAAILPCAPSRLNVVSGAALQMQRELIWFQEVEKIMQPSSREKKNLDGLTPRELFTEQHEELLERGEKWMKDRANCCMLVATIITTVVFGAVNNVPGGINDNDKIPNLLGENWFQVFAVSDAIAFSCSAFSTLMFLSILNSRYTEKAFLKSLPYKFMAGLFTLFISMIAMSAAFSGAFFLTYNHRKGWVPIIILVLAFLPPFIFVLLWPLFFDIFYSTLFTKFEFQPRKPMIR